MLLPEKLPADPFTTEISPTINPVTASLKVNVTVMGETLVVEADVEEIVTVG